MKSCYDLIQDRINDPNSHPGARNDGFRLALVGCGGAMAGAISASFATRLEAHNLRRLFDVSVSVSAGAIVSTYFLAEQAAQGSHMIPTYLSRRGFNNDLNSRKYINWWRVLRNKPIWDLSMCIDGLMFGKCPVNLSKLSTNEIPNYCIVSTETREAITIKIDSDNTESMKQTLFSTCRIPIIIDCDLAKQQHWDGSLAERIPIQQAEALGATHILVMHNESNSRTRSGIFFDLFVRLVGRKNPRLAQTISAAQGKLHLPAQDRTILELRPLVDIASFETDPQALWSAMVSAYWQVGNVLKLPEKDIPKLWADQIESDGTMTRNG